MFASNPGNVIVQSDSLISQRHLMVNSAPFLANAEADFPGRKHFLAGNYIPGPDGLVAYFPGGSFFRVINESGALVSQPNIRSLTNNDYRWIWGNWVELEQKKMWVVGVTTDRLTYSLFCYDFATDNFVLVGGGVSAPRYTSWNFKEPKATDYPMRLYREQVGHGSFYLDNGNRFYEISDKDGSLVKDATSSAISWGYYRTEDGSLTLTSASFAYRSDWNGVYFGFTSSRGQASVVLPYRHDMPLMKGEYGAYFSTIDRDYVYLGAAGMKTPEIIGPRVFRRATLDLWLKQVAAIGGLPYD